MLKPNSRLVLFYAKEWCCRVSVDINVHYISDLYVVLGLNVLLKLPNIALRITLCPLCAVVIMLRSAFLGSRTWE